VMISTHESFELLLLKLFEVRMLVLLTRESWKVVASLLTVSIAVWIMLVILYQGDFLSMTGTVYKWHQIHS
jgi:hypothetical protein